MPLRTIALLMGCAAALSAPVQAQQTQNPWEKYREVAPWGEEVPEHAWRSTNGIFWVYEREIKRGNPTAFWERGFYFGPENRAKRSTTYIELDCKGRARRLAQTTYDVDGNTVHEIDRAEEWKLIRPDSAWASYEAAFCS